ncbi:S-layer homology domain-containing protein [Peptoniphilus harei]|uniref:S-layer homology domain-containing protein n=1 Tax=Peptoniphilus harei TaxID=54005 RepID=UPI0011DDA273|nr:S-layer homology domain-containing protein [Peptoniphilus harei]
MNKKIISLVLALVMVLGTFTSVFAETAKEATAKKEEVKKTETKKAEAGEKVEKVVGKDNKIQYVIDKKLVEGYEDGTYGLDKNIKRSEITRLLVLANGNEELAKQLQGSMKIYSDVDAKHWANGVISVGTTVPSDANGIAMLAGYPDGSFKPENDVTYAELAKMLVVLAKKDLTADMVKNAVWATSWMTWAAQLGILDDVNVTDSNKAANRADAFTMIYNALYTMKEFKRVPANETRGIISNLTKDVLTLNEDSKKEYKVTGETVFVTGANGARQQIVRLNTLNLKTDDYYLGSLVRILVNDKNEVTHIIELGNPKELARGINFGEVRSNSIWRGVADNTVETSYASIDYKNGSKMDDYKVNEKVQAYAKINFKNNDVDAKSITFYNVKDVKDVTRNVELKINDNTEFYVANPGNNIMRKVANVNEALSLIGYKNYTKYALLDVYAGFDSDNLNKNYGAIKFNTADRHTAKVVVFNLVNKTQDGEKYRVLETSSSKFVTTIEKADGTKLDRNNMKDTSRFPLEYGDKFDVVELDDVRTGSYYKTLIDHSETEKFPIVEITKVRNDGKLIEIRDENGVRSELDLRDADIFSAKRFDGVEVGNRIQFSVDNKNTNVANEVSLLGKDFAMEGSLVGVIPVAHKGQEVGVVKNLDTLGKDYKTMTAKVDNNLFNAANQYGYANYLVYDNEYAELAKFVAKFPGRKIAFKVAERNDKGLYVATDIVENATQKPIAEFLKDVEKAEKELKVKLAKEILDTEMAKLNNEVFKDLANTALTQNDIKNAVKAAAEAKVDTTKVDVTVELVDAPASNANYASGNPVKAKVTLTSKDVNTVTKTVEFAGNVK